MLIDQLYKYYNLDFRILMTSHENDLYSYIVSYNCYNFQFRYSDGTDKILITLAIIGSVFYGIITPGQFILLGNLTDDFVEYTLCDMKNCTKPDLEESVTKVAVWYIGLSFGNFLFAWMAMGLFALSAERQIYKMRLAMFRNVINQEIGWFDEHSSGEINSRLVEYVFKFKVCMLVGILK